jgi:hypothetical protein
MNITNKEELFKSKNVVEMLTVANEYCLFLEKCEDYSREDILDYLQKICPLLYLKGSLLPLVPVNNPEANERFVTEEQWGYIYSVIRKKFATDDDYIMADMRDKTAPVFIKASLAENFADIYQDLKDFVMLYQRNTVAAKENAANECHRLFETHWGFRLISAHRQIHYMLFSEPEENQEIPLTF